MYTFLICAAHTLSAGPVHYTFQDACLVENTGWTVPWTLCALIAACSERVACFECRPSIPEAHVFLVDTHPLQERAGTHAHTASLA
jgi:hypothetical protein